MFRCRVLLIALLLLALFVPAARAAEPKDNPIATFYSGPEGYPAWTDSINWSHVINMKTYAKGKNDYEKFETAQKEMSEGGGVLYYPAGTYDFTTKDPGRGLMLVKGVVIRGEAPSGHPIAADGKLELPTKFKFLFRERLPGGKLVPDAWNFIGLGLDDYRDIKSEDHLGIAWVHLIGATVAFGPEFDWAKGKTWATAGSLLSDKVKKNGWDKRYGEGTHPIDPFMDGGKQYKGGTKGRFVFGCVLEDAAVLDDYLDPGYGPNGFHTSQQCARLIAYGSRILVANNLLPQSKKNFAYRQRTTASRGEKDTNVVAFDYCKTCGIDINKELLAHARQNDTCPGYFEEGVVVRDNFVFNHGHTGNSISGNWVTIEGNRNERAFLRAPDVAGGVLTLDGYEVAGPKSDNRSRAFALAGRNLWIDRNRSDNTGSAPGSDGEAILGRAIDGTPIYSWAITHNVHKRGNGAPGFMGGSDVDCHGLLIAWNETAGAVVGNAVERQGVTMADCAFLANKCDRTVPDEKTIKRLGLRAPLTTNPAGTLSPPTKVTTALHEDDAVKVAWAPATSDNAIGYRVERRIAGGKWRVIAYRPPRLSGDEDNPAVWVDFTAPPGKELTYRVVAINADDNDKGASEPTEAVTLPGGRPGTP
jgi:hypothetical protein